MTERTSVTGVYSSRAFRPTNQIKSNQITLLGTAPLIRSTGAQVQAYNYIVQCKYNSINNK